MSAAKIRGLLRRGVCQLQGIHGEFLDTRVPSYMQQGTFVQKSRKLHRKNYGETIHFVNVPKFMSHRVI